MEISKIVYAETPNSIRVVKGILEEHEKFYRVYSKDQIDEISKDRIVRLTRKGENCERETAKI